MIILSIGSQYKPNNGGNAKRVSGLLEFFAEMGHTVIVYTTTENNMKFDDEKYYKDTNIRIVRICNIIHLIKNINKIIAEKKVDVVVAHDFRTWLISSLIARNSHIVTECHAITQSTFYKEHLKKIGYSLMRKRTESIFVLSHNAKKVLSNKYGFDERIIHFTPNGITTNSINEKNIFGERENFVYAYAGTLYQWQGVGVLLEHSKDILAINSDIIIKIIGGGPMLDEVKDFIKKNKLEDRLFVTGYLEQSEYNKELESADVLLIPRPSTIETETAIPLKIFDAIQHKKPIIMSNVSGLTEVLSENEALVYPSDSSHLIIEKCKMIYRNEKLAKKLVLSALKKLKDWPTEKDIATKQIQIFEKLVSNNGH